MALRVKTGLMIGDGEAGSVRDPKHKASPQDAIDEAKLKRSVRAQVNFAESTPFAFFLIFLAELNGAPTSLVHGAYSTLFIARVFHGSFGITADDAVAIGRPVGYLTTAAVTALAGLYNVSFPRIYEGRGILSSSSLSAQSRL
jgi:uncharacterized membrane protein YecN with MAPEG domain